MRKLVRFRLAELSMNRNSFGLRGAIMVSKDGDAWEVGVHDLDCPQKDTTYAVTTDENGDDAAFSLLGWEIPRRCPQAPPDVVAVVWPTSDALIEAKKLIHEADSHLALESQGTRSAAGSARWRLKRALPLLDEYLRGTEK